MEETSFDVVVLGTGLTESIIAASLSKAGFKVAHIDENSYYGGDEASLSLDELIQWADKHSVGSASQKYSSISRSPNTLPQSRQYSISLCPSIIPSIGPLISSLISSGVSRYGGFRLLERVGIYDSPSGTVKNVPARKEDVFKNKDISLLDKRRLMRFLIFAAGDFEGKKELDGMENVPFYEFLKSVFSLNDEMAAAIVYSLAYCISPSDPTLSSLHRVRRYLCSAGRYGPSAFLVAHYGGAGEIAQGFCRSAAVSGAVYILGKTISSIIYSHTQLQHSRPPSLSHEHPSLTVPSPSSSVAPSPIVESLPDIVGDPPLRYTIHLSDFPEPLTCTVLISSASYIPVELQPHTTFLPPSPLYYHPHNVARCIAIIDQPLSFLSSRSHHSSGSPSVRAADVMSESEEQMPSTKSLANVQEEVDTAVLIFPPSSLPDGSKTTAVTVMVTGENAMSTPKGRWILYFSMPLLDQSSKPPELLLQPYLAATLALAVNPTASSDPPTSVQPLFTTFYIQHPSPVPPVSPLHHSSSSAPSKTYLISPPMPLLPIPDSMDAAAMDAETVFWKAVQILQPAKSVYKSQDESAVSLSECHTMDMDMDSTKPRTGEGQMLQQGMDGCMIVQGFWPPLGHDHEDDGEGW